MALSRRPLSASLALTGAVGAILLALAGASVAADELRAWHIEDGVELRYIAEAEFGDGRVVWSPNRRFFYFMTHVGELACDCVEYTLEIYDAARVSAFLGDQGPDSAANAPFRRVVRRTNSSDFDAGRAISNVRWAANETALYFLGADGESARRLYRYDVESDALTPLTPGDFDVGLYLERAGSIVYFGSGPDDRHPDALNRYPTVPIVADEITAQLTGRQLSRWQAFTLASGDAPRPLNARAFGQQTAWIAPDGRHAVMVFRGDGAEVPAAWRAYDRQPLLGVQYMLIDIASGQVRPMLDAPAGAATVAGRWTPYNALWSPDSSRVVLVSTALPLTRDAGRRAETPYLVEYDLTTGRSQTIAPLQNEAAPWAARAEWIEEGSLLRLRYRGPAFPFTPMGEVFYQRGANGRWREVAAPTQGASADAGVIPNSAGARLNVTIVQDMNTPARVEAEQDGARATLLSLAPELDGVALATQREFSWTNAQGEVEHAGLILPANTRSPPPLVIQVYHYKPDLFAPDGVYSTAFAGQALAANGMAVLYLDYPGIHEDIPAEGPAFVARVDQAVAALAAENLIDPGRVGLVGFSRGGFFTYYALTHPGRTAIRAGLVADGWTGSYGEYVTTAAELISNGDVSPFDRQWGEGSFWQNRAAWLEHAPGFNVDRVEAPVLFTITNRSNVELSLETLGAFRINRKPFDLVLFPRASHQLHLPRERLASLSLTVDWFRFWLLDEQTADPLTRDQYNRWERLRAAAANETSQR
jgi:dipeptidyl aminopeptidase/acylaminoacyl peptidase